MQLGNRELWSAIRESEAYIAAHRSPIGDPLGAAAWYVRYLIARCAETKPLPELGWVRDLVVLRNAIDDARAARPDAPGEGE